VNRTIVVGLVGTVLALSVIMETGCKLRKKTGTDYAPDYSNNNGTTASNNNGTTTTDYGGGTAGGLTQAYVPKSGLVRIHYMPDLVANPDSDNLTFLEPTASASVNVKSLVTITTNVNPISQDPNEYGRVLQGARAKALGGYRLISTIPGHCYKDNQGVETRWQFDEGGTTMQGRACAFIHNKHGYSFMYAFKPTSTGDEVKLRRIVDATELTD
jgi:hypothetical protein